MSDQQPRPDTSTELARERNREAAERTLMAWIRTGLSLIGFGFGFAFAAGLQLTLAVLAIVITPLSLSLFYALFELETERVTPLEVARQVAQVQFLPVCIGLLLQRFGPKLAAVMGPPLVLIANVMFLVLVALALIPGVRMILHLGGPTLGAIVLMVAVSLIIGHLLGGPIPEERTSLAVASIARNIGLALFITALSEAENPIIPTLLAYMILGAIVAVPYSVWRKRAVAPVASGDPPLRND